MEYRLSCIYPPPGTFHFSCPQRIPDPTATVAEADIVPNNNSTPYCYGACLYYVRETSSSKAPQRLHCPFQRFLRRVDVAVRESAEGCLPLRSSALRTRVVHMEMLASGEEVVDTRPAVVVKGSEAELGVVDRTVAGCRSTSRGAFGRYRLQSSTVLSVYKRVFPRPLLVRKIDRDGPGLCA